MNVRGVVRTISLLSTLASPLVARAGGMAMGSAFTYQGQLKFDGAPVSAICDFEFSLWDFVLDGDQVGSTASRVGVAVSNGLFQADIDFGLEAFNGQARWLQVAARCPSGVGPVTTLTPRELLTSVPYASQTRGMYVNSTGRLGIGTLEPTHALTVQSTDQSTLRLIGPTGAFGWGAQLNFGDSAYAYIEEDSDDELNFHANVFRFDQGQVGVGITTPLAKLDVASSGETAIRATTNWIGVYGAHQGSGSFPGVWGDTDSTSSGGSGVRGYATAATGGAYGVHGRSFSTGGVGVFAENVQNGTALAATGNGSFREQATLRVENTQPSAGMAAYVKSQGSWATMHVENDSTGEVLWLQRDNSDGPFIVAHNGDTGMRVFSVSQHGYTKVAVLEVAGGADLSEGFDVSPPKSHEGDESPNEPMTPQPGMVVSIDAERPGRLVVSSKAYDNAVAGILSGAGGVHPGMIMGQSGTRADGELPVALSGRVYCLCDAANGAIRPGDLLTTSARPGHAMKVTDRDRAAGAVIGKAMTSLEDGSGLVLVLVSLQ
ncbi:MAG: hypothetical protein AABZ12_08275 [Planctomycetota bacterium]